MSARFISSSIFAVRCARCRQQIAKGEPIYYDKAQPKGSRCWHEQCNAQPEPIPAPAEPQRDSEPHSESMGTFERVGQCDVHRFDDIGSMVAASMKPHDLNRRAWEMFQTSSHGSGRRWYGVDTLAEVQRIVEQQQWPEGAAKLMQKLGDIGATLTPRSVRRVRRWADNGDHVEMSKVWAGRTDVAWSRCYREQRTGPQRVRIVADVGINCTTDSEVAFWRGAAAVRLADLLTTSGYNVQIEVAHFAENHGQNNRRSFACFTTVKPYTAPLDVIALASTACLPGFLRHYCFQQQDASPYKVHDHHGHACPQHKVMPPDADAVMVSHTVSDAATARDWIAAQLAELQGEPTAAAA